jgi:nucleotide-binding universal stress UspA family protein
MFQSILVPLDGSSFGEQALPLALSIASRSGGAIQVVHVHVPLATIYAESMANVENTLDPGMKKQEQAYLDGVVRRVAAVSRVPISSALLEGSIVDVLHEHIRGRGADLIVMTTHGRGPLSRWWLGSVTDEMLRHESVPLLVVRPQERPITLTRDEPPQHILVPLDASALAEQMLATAVELGGLTKAAYTLCRVVQPYVGAAFEAGGLAIGAMVPPPIEPLRQEAADYLERVAHRLRNLGLGVETAVVVSDQPAAAILDVAKDNHCDLIALETHGRGGLARLLVGSVADKVLRSASVPVLIHRRPAGKGE